MKGFKQLGTSSVARGVNHWLLLGAKCVGCGTLLFPALTACPDCDGCDFVASPLPTAGKLYSYSVVHMGPKGVDVPYVVGYVDLCDGLRVFGRIDLSPDAVEIGQPLELRVTPTDPHKSQFIYRFAAPDGDASQRVDA
jgi:uncharacterized OB-fold protein